jgi:hypothetical protein
MIVRDLQSVIGRETMDQLEALRGGAPPTWPSPASAAAPTPSGSSRPYAYLPAAERPRLVGVEAAGHGVASGAHAASISAGRRGVLHGALMYLLHDADGQISPAHSVSAGLDYPGVGPEHSYYHDEGMATYVAIDDDAALAAFRRVAELEGIIPALETAHAFAYVIEEAPRMSPDQVIVVNLSGRGDKDVAEVARLAEAVGATAAPSGHLGAAAAGPAMSVARVRAAFAAAAAAGRAAFVPYLTAGYPDAERAFAAGRVLARHADLMEVGLPYSDPLGDGPTIQRASEAALAAGATTRGTFDLVRRLRGGRPRCRSR